MRVCVRAHACMCMFTRVHCLSVCSGEFIVSLCVQESSLSVCVFRRVHCLSVCLGEFMLRLRQLEKSLLSALNESKGRLLDDDR